MFQNFKSLQQQILQASYLNAMQYECLPKTSKLQLQTGELY